MPTDSRRPFFTKSKLIWILVSLPVVVLVALGCMWYAGQSALKAELAALRAQGLPTTARAVNDFYVVPEDVADTTELWVNAIDAVESAGLGRRGKTLPFVGDGPKPVPAPGEAWAELEASRTLLGELDREFQYIRQAAEAGGQARFPTDFSAGIATLLPYTQDSRNVARLLVLNAHVSAHDGNASQALQDLKAVFALSDALQGGPMLISQMVRISIYGMGCIAVEQLMPHCQWSDAELESLQTAIRSARFREDFRGALCGARAICLSALDGVPLGPFRAANKQKVLRVFESSLEGLSSSWADALSRERETLTRLSTVKDSRITQLSLGSAWRVLPALEAATTAGARAEARQKCANAGVAAQRFRLQHGRFPDSLAEIGQELLGSPSEPSAKLIDPFDGRPLRYKTEETRVVIYSIDENELDDGGDCDDSDGPPWPLDVGFSVQK